MLISACVPCFNNEATIGCAVRSLFEQSIPPSEVFVVDDGSKDRSADRSVEAGARVVSSDQNLGRGAIRARAIETGSGDLLLSVDATAKLSPDFGEKTLPWFEDPKVAAVYGRITQPPAQRVADRWRGRHLYRLGETHEPGPATTLITGGVIMRRSAILEVGNFDTTLRHSEDRELGRRLLAGGWKIIYEPRAVVTTLVSNTVAQALERYWRWNSGVRPEFRFRDYAKMTWYSMKVLAARDLRSRDLGCAVMSAILPHYCALRTLRGR